ncbi:hypothetical protein TNCV_656611 [Trichonephila clavipes]|nr:hypothetical protein TNCV_656611 [Trichonephila clavipes]
MARPLSHLQRYREEKYGFQSQIVTVGETRCHHFEKEASVRASSGSVRLHHLQGNQRPCTLVFNSWFTYGIINATCLIEAYEIHRVKGLILRLRLAIVLSAIQVSVQFSSGSPEFPGRTLWRWSRASHFSSSSSINLAKGLATRRLFSTTQTLYVYKHPCLLRDSNLGTAINVTSHYTGCAVLV